MKTLIHRLLWDFSFWWTEKFPNRKLPIGTPLRSLFKNLRDWSGEPMWYSYTHDRDGEPVFYLRDIISWNWNGHYWTLRIHKMIRADPLDCFHTHPFLAFRLILWNGYDEQVYESLEYQTVDFAIETYDTTWKPGMWGWIPPEFCHRVSCLRTGKPSYSLFIHAEKSASIQLRGVGWS